MDGRAAAASFRCLVGCHQLSCGLPLTPGERWGGGGVREMGWGGLYKDREAGGGGADREEIECGQTGQKGWCKETGHSRTDRRQADRGGFRQQAGTHR